jgi:uncharacterized membrane protein YkvA (DUF1232 family)
LLAYPCSIEFQPRPEVDQRFDLRDVRPLDRIRSWARKIKRDAMTLWFASKHPRTPWLAKALSVFVVAYALSPIDLIPDFIPVIGYLDDALLLPALIWLAVRMLPRDVLDDCRGQADRWIAENGRKPRSYIAAAAILALWAAVAVVTYRFFRA